MTVRRGRVRDADGPGVADDADANHTPGVAGVSADARTSNWRFAVPSDPVAPVVVGLDGLPLDQVLAGGPLGAVFASDLAAWVRPGAGTSPRDALTALCARTAAGGWLAVGFANRWYPVRPKSARALGLGSVRQAMARAGLTPVGTYLAFPDHLRPALLVPAQRAAELDHVLARMPVTFVPGTWPLPRLARRTLSVLRAVALHTPHPIRARLAPGYLVVARRPP